MLPTISIMIPTYNCAQYLSSTLKSILTKEIGNKIIQIEVVDDNSKNDDPEFVVKELGNGQVTFFRQPNNVGAIENFNTCIRRAKGKFIHILHGDDMIMPNFYSEILYLIELYPNLSLYGTRSFFIDEENVIIGVSQRLRSLEESSFEPSEFYYTTPVQFSGIVVSKASYEQYGYFDTNLIHTADRDMWARLVYGGGCVISNKVLSCYRTFSSNDTSKLERTSQNLQDCVRLNLKFKDLYSDFNFKQANDIVLRKSIEQIKKFRRLNDIDALKSNWRFFDQNADLKNRLRYYLSLVKHRL